MIARIESGGVSRRIKPAAFAGVVLVVVCIVALACEGPATPATIGRIALAIVATGFAIFARKRSLVERAALFIGIEALGGIVAFASVDAPFILAHQAQIGHFAVSVAREVGRTH